VAVFVGGGVSDGIGSVLIIGGDVAIDSVGMSLDAGVQEIKTIARMIINGILVIIVIAIILLGTAQQAYVGSDFPMFPGRPTSS